MRWSRKMGMGLLGGLAAMSPASGQRDPLAPLPAAPPVPTPAQPPLPTSPTRALPGPVAPAVSGGTVARPAPAGLAAQVRAHARAMDGMAGVAVVSLSEGWRIGWQEERYFPQQSVSKLWVTITALDLVDKGRIRLDDRVTLTRDDLTLFHQPLRDLVLGKGSHTTTLRDLMTRAITQSDNTANDKLMRAVGGPQAVRAMIAAKRLGAIRFYDGERALQSRVAGLIWSQSYSVGDAFYRARGALPLAVRRDSFERYVADPYDGASAGAIAEALARLYRGQLLSPASTRLLLGTMAQTRTGKMRVRAALKPGWQWSHKTGTGQELQGRIGGINDIGLLTAPDGRAYAVAIMTVPNNTNGDAQTMMRKVVEAVIAAHEAR